MNLYITHLISEALKNLPPIDWSIVAIELLVLTSLTLFAIAMVRNAIGWCWRRWHGRR